MKEKKLSNKKTNHAITMVIIYAVLILLKYDAVCCK